MNINDQASSKNLLILLDDNKDWLRIFERGVKKTPQAQDLITVPFTDDLKATQFVQKNAKQILGYIQDLNRDPFHAGGLSEGVQFLNDVVSRFTPWARTIVISGYANISAIRSLYESANYEASFIQKISFDYDIFQKELLWLIEGRTVQSRTVHPKERSEDYKIIEIIEPPWKEVCRYISEKPDFLHKMDPRMFENLVAEIFREYGWEVELSSRTRDGGYDILAIKRSFPSDIQVLAEAKRYSPKRPVGVEIVRRLYGVRSLRAVSQVVLATSSYVSEPAKREFSRVVPWELDFMERDKILNWCKRNGGIEISGDFKSN